MTYDKLKLPTAIIAALLPLSGAMAENYDGQGLTGQTLNTTSTMDGWSFVGTNLTNVTFTPPNSLTLRISNVDFSNADFTGTTFTNVSFKGGINFSGSNITYEQFNQGISTNNTAWNNVNFSNMDLAGWRLGVASYDINNPGKGMTNNYTNLKIADSKINNATLYYSTTYSVAFKKAITSTKSWKDKDLSGVRIAGLDTIRNYDFTGFSLQNASFYRPSMTRSGAEFTCNGFNFTSADLRGYSISYKQGSSTHTTTISNVTYKNTIQATGSELNTDNWDFVFSNGDLSITMLTAVPEPAIYAAVAGALSLALAAARRRKA